MAHRGRIGWGIAAHATLLLPVLVAVGADRRPVGIAAVVVLGVVALVVAGRFAADVFVEGVRHERARWIVGFFVAGPVVFVAYWWLRLS